MTTHNFNDGNGAVPAHQHSNGGGWVADTASVDDTAYVGLDATVFGTALVSNEARVSDKARVSGDALVYGDARVSGKAQVFGDAQVYGDARVSGKARVSGDALVSGDAWVSGNAQVYDDAWVSGTARVYGNAQVYGDALVSGNAKVFGKASIHNNMKIYYGHHKWGNTKQLAGYLQPTKQEDTAGSKKYDGDKSPLVQGCFNYFPKALLAVAMVSKFGAEKYKVSYDEQNWKEVEDGFKRYTDAAGRHLLGDAVDGPYDPDSNLLHAAHCAWDALARLELLMEADTPLTRETT